MQTFYEELIYLMAFL